MIRLIWSGIRAAPGRAMALAAGILVASVSFALLTASVNVGVARVKGAVGKNWRGAYDLLVLPAGPAAGSGPGSAPGTQLVQGNYLSAGTGGISLAQYRRISAMPGVAVAAPLEIVGYVLETVSVPVRVPAATAGQGARVLEVSSRFTADQGLSTYPAQADGYVYVTPDRLGPYQLGRPAASRTAVSRTAASGPAASGPVDSRTEQLPDGTQVRVCPISTRQGSAPQATPFAAPGGGGPDACISRAAQPAGPVTAEARWSFPVLVAGIDPAAENKLTHLSAAVTAGRYLQAGDGAGATAGGAAGFLGDAVVPVLGSTVAFDGDQDSVTVSALPSQAVAIARSGGSPAAISAALAALPAQPAAPVTVTSAAAWQQLLRQLSVPVSADSAQQAQLVGQYWSAGAVTYRRGPGRQLTAVARSTPDSVWLAGRDVNGLSYVAAPASAADAAFRPLAEHPAQPRKGALLQLVGQFNPLRLPGFTGAGPASPLASYRSPADAGATAATRQLLAGQPLLPDGNMAGYLQQPPLLYTTLAGAANLENPAAFAGADAQAPIGSVRIRVGGLRGSVPQKLAKIAAVGHAISQATGLRVEVVAGASTQPVTIALPAGQFGRPALSLSEPWTAVGVSLVVLHQADRESLALFVLILIVCALFLASAALAGVRGRRRQIGALQALGWGQLPVFTLVAGEVAALGVLAGCAGAALFAILIRVLSLDVTLWRSLLVLPVAVVLSLAAGLCPAWLAARAQPLRALAGSARPPRRGGRRIRTLSGLAATGVTRTPGRSGLAAAALALGVACLAVLLAAQASFTTSIGDSALAGLVSATVRGSDLASALLAVGLGAVAVADITYLNLRERSGELAALAACGWGRAQIARLLGTEALLTAAAGAIAGAAAGLIISALAFGLSLPVAGGALAAAAGGIVVAVACSALVVAAAAGQSLTAELAADE